jgi:hypothetical protein
MHGQRVHTRVPNVVGREDRAIRVRNRPENRNLRVRRGRHPHHEERGQHASKRLPDPHDQVIGIGTAGALPEPALHFIWSRRIRPETSARAVGFPLAKDPTNHRVEKEPTESEEPRNSGERSGEVDPPGVP